MASLQSFHRYLQRTRYSFYSWIFINRSLTLFLVVLYVITFCIVLPGMCNNLPYSKFYSPLWSADEMRNRATQLNNRRLIHADQYLAKLDRNISYKHFEALLTSDQVDLAVGVVTVKRHHKSLRLGYLTQVVTRLMDYYSVNSAFPNKLMFICDTYAGPGGHEEAIHLGKYVPLFQRFPKGNASFVIMDHFDKEKEDYVFCLKRALHYNPKYIIIFEDDALPRNNFFSVLENTLENHVQRKPRTDTSDIVHHWAYVKLYYPERWQGYSYEFPKIIELFGTGLFGGSIFLIVLLGCNRRRFRTITKVIFFLAGATYCIFSACLIGRQYFLEWRRISSHLHRIVPAPNCCSPANVYPYDKALQLVSYLSKHRCSPTFPLDAALDSFAKDNNYMTHLIEPNLIKHIGMYSSLKSNPEHFEEFLL